MALWNIIAHEDFPIWVVARRLIKREPLGNGKVKWLVESDGYVQLVPRSAKGILSVEPAEAAEAEEGTAA